MTTESLENISGFESSSFSIDLGEIYTFVCGSREFWCYIGEGTYLKKIFKIPKNSFV